MNRRAFLSTSAGAAVALRAQDRPNVIVILADDLGWRDVGFHDSEIKTPNLDRLAREGVELTRFYSQPLCSPTRSALMTGRSPMRYGVQYSVVRPWVNYGVPVEEHFMPESFRAAGYQTAMAGKWHLGHSRKEYMPNARGFDSAYGHLNGAIDYFTHERDGGIDWHRDGKTVVEDGYSTDLIAGEAERVIKERKRDRPLFLYVAFNAPHAPLQAPQDRLAKYSAIADPRRRTFAAMVDALDDGIGRIARALKEQGMAENTLIFFFSDNGGPIAQAARNEPLRGAKGSCWEGGIRVPAFVYWPGRVKPGVSPQVMSAADLFPTLASAAGVRTRNKLRLDGRDLWQALSSGRVVPRNDDLFFAVETGADPQHAVHRGEWKLVRVGATDHLFRIDRDPNEKEDLVAKHPDVAADLGRAIDEWRKLHPAQRGTRGARPMPAGYKAPPRWAEAAR
jgi:arylsulfatase A-like enzyme